MTATAKVEVSDLMSACGCNAAPHTLAWHPTEDVVAFAGGTNVCLMRRLGPEHLGGVRTFSGHARPVNSVRWLRWSECAPLAYMVSCGQDGATLLWRYKAAALERLTATLPGHDGSVVAACGVASTERANLLTVATDRRASFSVVNLQTAEVLQAFVLTLGGFAFCADLIYADTIESLVAATGHDDNIVRVYVETPRANGQRSSFRFDLAFELRGHTDWVRDLRLDASSHGIRLCSGGQDAIVRLWCIELTAEPTPTAADNGRIVTRSLTFAANGLELSARADAVLSAHDDWVYGVAWTDGADEVLSVSVDKCVLLWRRDRDSGVWTERVRLGRVGGHACSGFYAAASAGDARALVAVDYNGGLHMWTATDDHRLTWRSAVVSAGHSGAVTDCCWEPRGAYVLSCGADQTTRIHAQCQFVSTTDGAQLSVFHEIARPQVHGHDLQCITSVSRWCFVSGAEEKLLRAFRAPAHFQSTLQSLCKLNIAEVDGCLTEGACTPALGLSNKAVSPTDGQESRAEVSSSATAPTENQLQQSSLWPEVFKLYGHGYEVYSVSANRDGSLVASACRASQPEHAAILVWATADWRQLQRLEAHSLTVTELRFSPDDRLLLSVSRDRTWSLFGRDCDDDAAEWRRVAHSHKRHSRIIWSAAWTSDSRSFATASRDKQVIVWRLDDAAPVTASHKQVDFCDSLTLAAAVTAVDFAPLPLPDGSHLLAAGLESGNCLLYSFGSSFQLLTALPLGLSHSATALLSEIQLASCSDDGCLRVVALHLAYIE